VHDRDLAFARLTSDRPVPFAETAERPRGRFRFGRRRGAGQTPRRVPRLVGDAGLNRLLQPFEARTPSELQIRHLVGQLALGNRRHRFAGDRQRLGDQVLGGPLERPIEVDTELVLSEVLIVPAAARLFQAERGGRELAAGQTDQGFRASVVTALQAMQGSWHPRP